ncbi:hypothetical protein [Streptomyces sp.]|uniref:hypothetical protein n=1 Tax=Streptomyces sp. TaxID=1931 RepID=UPI002D441D72|nr:hypothetical protein [Streptomyces sp.]HZF91611.1 hypothetical protein [Streptomyces sp.]
MRSARMLVAIAGASAALALGAPGAYATGPGSDHEDSSYSKEQEKDGGHDSGSHKDGGEESGSHKEGGHDSGSHKDGGEEWGSHEDGGHDSGSYKDEHDKDSWKEKDSWGGDHEKPRGGVHTGGGALAGQTVTAGGLAALAVAGTGLYAMRRRKTAESAR